MRSLIRSPFVLEEEHVLGVFGNNSPMLISHVKSMRYKKCGDIFVVRSGNKVLYDGSVKFHDQIINNKYFVPLYSVQDIKLETLDKSNRWVRLIHIPFIHKRLVRCIEEENLHRSI